jgi:hypothetical protein
MRASTPYKAVLRYLYHREIAKKTVNPPVEEVFRHFEDLDTLQGGPYGLSSIGPSCSYTAEVNLYFLHRLGYAVYSPQNPHIRLTPLGRRFAELIKFPEELEEALPEFFSRNA